MSLASMKKRWTPPRAPMIPGMARYLKVRSMLDDFSTGCVCVFVKFCEDPTLLDRWLTKTRTPKIC